MNVFYNCFQKNESKKMSSSSYNDDSNSQTSKKVSSIKCIKRLNFYTNFIYLFVIITYK